MREKRVVQESFDRTPRGHRGLVKVGLVLGAGGVIGGAYHAGALTALAHDLGWDPRDADVIVGTSAGSLVGAQLRHGARTEVAELIGKRHAA